MLEMRIVSGDHKVLGSVRNSEIILSLLEGDEHDSTNET